jgi:hypothetical protein
VAPLFVDITAGRNIGSDMRLDIHNGIWTEFNHALEQWDLNNKLSAEKLHIPVTVVSRQPLA